MELWQLWERLGFQLTRHDIIRRQLDQPLKVIDIDVDGVLLDLYELWYGAYNYAWGDNLHIDKVHSWDVHLYCRGGKQVYKYITPDLYEHMMPIPGAVYCTRLLARRYKVRALTSCTDATFPAKVARLRQLFPWIEEVRRKDTNKHEMGDIELLIDDGAHNFEGGTYAGLLFDYAHNRSAKLRDGVLRIPQPYWQTVWYILQF